MRATSGKSTELVLATSLAATVVAVVAVIFHINTESRIQSQHSERLTTINESLRRGLLAWTAGHKRVVQSWADHDQVRASTRALLAAPRDPESLISHPAQAELRELFAAIIESHDLRGFFIIAPDRISIASSRDGNLGTENLLTAQPEFLHALFAGNSIVTLPQESDVPLPDESGQARVGMPTMFKGAPIRDEVGNVIAVLTLRLDPYGSFQELFDSASFGDHGESFAFTDEGILVSESRYADDLKDEGLLSANHRSSLNVIISAPEQDGELTPIARNAIEQGEGIDLSGYSTYTGDRVIGASQWLPELNMGIATEWFYGEAYAVRNAMRYSQVGLAIIVIVVVAGLLTYLQRMNLRSFAMQEQSAGIIQSLGEGVSTIDKRGKVLSWNDAAERILGYSAEEIVGENIRIAVSPEHRDYHDDYLAEYLESGEKKIMHARRRVEGQHKDGHLVPIDVSISEYRIDEDVYWTGILSDMTEQAKYEEALQDARLVAEKSNISKSTFLSNMSHEIRTPLNAVIGFAQILHRESKLPDGERELLRSIVTSSEHLLELINSVLDMAKIESGSAYLDDSVFCLPETLDELVEMFSIRAKECDLHFEMQYLGVVPPYIRCDRGKFRQIIINLIGNAFKFTDRGGVTVRVGVEREKANRITLRIEVEDTGTGIASEDLGTLFAPFEQSERARMERGGTGLGLAISRDLARLMNGDITVMSEVGKGSTFRLSVDVAEASADDFVGNAEHGRVIVGVARHQARYKILIADDVSSNRLLLRRLLAPFGFEILEAVNGQNAIEIFETWNPDVILMDLAMPVMDGYEAISTIRGMQGGADVRMIVVTASSFDDGREKALRAGADGFIRKPFREIDLYIELERTAGIDWIEDSAPAPLAGKNGSGDAAASTVPVELIRTLPADDLEKLGAAAEDCNAQVVNSVIDEIETNHSEAAKALRGLANRFDYEGILSIIRKGSHTHGDQRNAG